MDIISMAQQARPKVTGQTEFLRIQLTAKVERGEKDAFRLLEAVADFVEFDAVLCAALESSEEIVVPLCRNRHESIINPWRGMESVSSSTHGEL